MSQFGQVKTDILRTSHIRQIVSWIIFFVNSLTSQTHSCVHMVTETQALNCAERNTHFKPNNPGPDLTVANIRSIDLMWNTQRPRSH